MCRARLKKPDCARSSWKASYPVTAPWLAEQGWLLTLGTWGGPGAPEIEAAEAVARLVNGLVAA